MKQLIDYVKDFTYLDNAILLSGRTLEKGKLIFFTTFESYRGETLIYLYACEREGEFNILSKPEILALWSETSHEWIS